MKELKEITASFDQATRLGKKTALATVVKVEGSAYRREGARMLITEDGQLTGAISGGCLEGDALRRALHVMAQQRPMVVTYDTTDDDHGLGLQLGCEGIVHLLIEPLDATSDHDPVAFFKAIFEKRQATAIATVYNLEKRHQQQFGTCSIFDEKGRDLVVVKSLPAEIQAQVAEHAKEVLRRGRSAFFTLKIEEETQVLFLEYVPTQPNIVVFGAGNDIRPLVEIASVLGWETTVVDGRPSLAKKERFHQASCVLVAKPEVALSQINVDENTFFLLMTHNYNYDLAVLKNLLQQNVRYIGLLGPKKKYERMLSELAEKSLFFDKNALPQVFAPVGLDIGGSTPEGIALSIIAEIQAVLSGRVGGFLKERDGAIHG